MNRPVRIRFWVEALLATISLVALAATVAWPEWIEELSGRSPDGGSGAAEWLVPAVLAVGAVASSLVARREWLRPPAVA